MNHEQVKEKVMNLDEDQDSENKFKNLAQEGIVVVCILQTMRYASFGRLEHLDQWNVFYEADGDQRLLPVCSCRDHSSREASRYCKQVKFWLKGCFVYEHPSGIEVGRFEPPTVEEWTTILKG